jgi:hypothetical protein
MQPSGASSRTTRSHSAFASTSRWSGGLGIDACGFNAPPPISRLPAVINGIVAVPIMVAMMLVVSGNRGPKSLLLPQWLKLLGWLAAALMALAVGLLLWSSFPQ